MFVRVKNIKGRKYAYLVENEWTPWGSRQRVTKYLGKLISVERAKEDVLELPNGFKEAIMVAITQEVENHHAAEQKINVDLERGTIKKDGKNIVLGMNEGYLCNHTLSQLISYAPGENPSENANKLANLAVEAGLKLTNEQFMHLFELA